MAKTLIKLKKLISTLKKETEKVRAKEATGVIQGVKAAIDFYGLTAQDLFPKAGKAATKAKPSKKSKKSPLPAKYKDNVTGKTWSGRGRPPAWFVNATVGGSKADDSAT